MHMYIVLKSICSIKEHWWSLTLSWLDKFQRMFSTAHEFSFNRETKPQTTTCFKLCKCYDFNFIIFYLSNAKI